jgi:hypothetical protein
MDSTAMSVSADLTEQVLRTLERARQPLTFFQIQRGLPRPYQKRTDEIRQCLEEQKLQGRVCEYPPYRSKAPRFWTRPPEQFARAVMTEVLDQRPCTQRELFLKIRGRLQGIPDGRLHELLAQMLLEGPIRKLPPRVGGRASLLCARSPQPCEYLAPVFSTLFDTLFEVFKRLETEGVDRDPFLQEAESMWRAMPWDRLSAGPSRQVRSGSTSEPPLEPVLAAAENSPFPEALNVPPADTPLHLDGQPRE